jgi:hypothetical protein
VPYVKWLLTHTKAIVRNEQKPCQRQDVAREAAISEKCDRAVREVGVKRDSENIIVVLKYYQTGPKKVLVVTQVLLIGSLW